MSETSEPLPPPPPPAPRPSLARRLLSTLAWLYLLTLLAVYLLMRQTADRWWPATLIAFGPRWVFATPLILLVPLTVIVRRRALLPLAAALLTLVPLLDFTIPWRKLARTRPGQTLRVLSCNVDHQSLDARAMAALIAATRPDVVLFQEWNNDHLLPLFPDRTTYPYVRGSGELFIASRYPFRKAEDIGLRWPAFTAGAAIRYEVDTPAGTVDVYNLHLASPHFAFDKVIARTDDFPDAVQANSDHRRRQLENLAASLAKRDRPHLLAGDFNTPEDTPNFRHNLGHLQDAFTAAGTGPGHTYFARWTQTRIDHLLASPHWQVTNCTVGPNVHSPHRPLITDLQLPTPPSP